MLRRVCFNHHNHTIQHTTPQVGAMAAYYAALLAATLVAIYLKWPRGRAGVVSGSGS